MYTQRPPACQEFPFRLFQTPGGVFVGASFACSAIAQGLGPRVEADSQDWGSWRLQPGAEHLDMSWDDYRRVEAYVVQQLDSAHGLWTSALGVALATPQQDWTRLGQRTLQGVGPELEPAVQRTFRGLMALMESDPASAGVSRAEQVLSALAHGQPYWSQVFGKSVPSGEILARLEEPDDEHWRQVEPFFRHLVFRKFLWGPPGVVARVCLLPVLNEIVRFWTCLQSPQPEREHRLRAIRELERRLTFHAHGWEQFVAGLASVFVSQTC